MDTVRIYLNQHTEGTVTCVRCGHTRVLNCRIQCPQVLDGLGTPQATVKVKCRCGARFQAQFDCRKHHRKTVQLAGTLRHVHSGHKIADIVIASLSATGVGFVTVADHPMRVGDVYAATFLLDDPEQSPIDEQIIIHRLYDEVIGAEFYPQDTYNYALDFYLYEVQATV